MNSCQSNDAGRSCWGERLRLHRPRSGRGQRTSTLPSMLESRGAQSTSPLCGGGQFVVVRAPMCSRGVPKSERWGDSAGRLRTSAYCTQILKGGSEARAKTPWGRRRKSDRRQPFVGPGPLYGPAGHVGGLIAASGRDARETSRTMCIGRYTKDAAEHPWQPDRALRFSRNDESATDNGA
jgi:hypothetical protein